MKPSRDDIVTLFDKFDKDFREFALRLTVGIKHFFRRRRSLSIALSLNNGRRSGVSVARFLIQNSYCSVWMRLFRGAPDGTHGETVCIIVGFIRCD